MPEILIVRWGARTVGRLRGDDTGRLGFTYAAEWLDSDTATPISISLPLREDEYLGGAGHGFFANLLPEGAVREAVCRRLGISVDNDLALLRAIGGECAGALSVVPAEEPSLEPRPHEYEPLATERLRSLVASDDVVPLLVGGPTTRLSLAGAQDKLPVALLDGRVHLPIAAAPSTHILKLPHSRFAHVPANEAFTTGLAHRVGVDAVDVQLFDGTDPPSLLVARYDRVPSSDPWPVARLHQEDLCQALGLPPGRKYEQEGGPTLAAAVGVVRDHVRDPLVDVPRLLQWQAFNVIAGNSDGHGKNVSLVHGDRGLRLAPFYDLLSTRQYARLDRALAMSVGGRRDPDQLRDEQWRALAEQLGIAPRVVLGLVRDLAERCGEAIDPWTKEFRERHGDQPILQTLPTWVSRRARRVLRELRSL